MAGELKLLSEAVTVCSTSSWLVQTTVVPALTVRSAAMKLKFSIETLGPLGASASGLGGAEVASAAGGTGVGSAGAVMLAAAGLEQATTKAVEARPKAMGAHSRRRVAWLVLGMMRADTPLSRPRMGLAGETWGLCRLLTCRSAHPCSVLSSAAPSGWPSSEIGR